MKIELLNWTKSHSEGFRPKSKLNEKNCRLDKLFVLPGMTEKSFISFVDEEIN